METMLSSKRIPLSKRENFKVDDSVIEMDLPIYGAKISPTVSSKGSFQGAPIEIVKISCGSGVTDYVTHESNFKYSTYGIHIGQDDRLTFLGVSQKVEVSLIDCRKDFPYSWHRNYRNNACESRSYDCDTERSGAYS